MRSCTRSPWVAAAVAAFALVGATAGPQPSGASVSTAPAAAAPAPDGAAPGPAREVAPTPAPAPTTATRSGREAWLEQIYSWGMWPLWACSIALVALVLERMRALQAKRIVDEPLVEKVAALATQGNVEGARQACARSATVVGQAWAQGLHEFSLGGMDLAEALTNATVLAFKPLKRNLRAIATLSVISPLFGLLGTILGMIVIFGEIAATGGADKGKLAGGMGLALFTTAGGLFVAIPAILFNRYLTGRLTGFTERVELAINQVHYRYLHAAAQAKAAPPSEASGKGGTP